MNINIWAFYHGCMFPSHTTNILNEFIGQTTSDTLYHMGYYYPKLHVIDTSGGSLGYLNERIIAEERYLYLHLLHIYWIHWTYYNKY
jgi:hypothetical protein